MAEDTKRQVSWKPRDENQLIGTEIPRIDGVDKSSGYARYTADTNPKGTLYCRLLTANIAQGTIADLDVEPAKKVQGVKAVHVFRDEGTEIRWDGTLIAAVAAERPEQAAEGVQAIKIEYKEGEHFVDEDDLEGAKQAGRTKELGDQQQGDVDQALESADMVHKGYYGIHTITHACMEPHGTHVEWKGDDSLLVHLSTQNVSGTGGQFAGPLGLDANNVTIVCDYVGGGFGSKFAADEWGLACAQLAKETGRPVRLMLDRATDLKIAGNRPSGFIDVTIAADKDGNITAWDSHQWGTDGMNGSPVSLGVVPYIFEFENRNRRATGIRTNCGPKRAWRAPNHPQACALTQTAMDDLAAKLGMDSYDLFMKNLDKTARGKVYAEEMEVGAQLIDWKAKWHPHGKGGGRGPVKQGLGLAMHTWGGRAHGATCTVKVHPDGTVETFGGSQDIGTGTRTVIAITLAETFGLPVDAVKVHIGSSEYPRSGPSGGSTTVGGVSGPNRRAGLKALWQIFDLVGKKYDVDPSSLEARDRKIFSNGEEVCTWKQAASLIGPMPLEVQGEGPKDDGLTDQGVAGVQMADVSVDTETGQIRINKFVAVQDCGLIIDLLTAKSQVHGAQIMAISYALMEERIMDNKTGRFINADFENYKVAHIGDIGELVAEMHQTDEQYNRGVIGLGEPPVIPGGAAISNAVANAIGVRVPVLPMTPPRVLEALKGGQS